jgi:hypothetical protein
MKWLAALILQTAFGSEGAVQYLIDVNFADLIVKHENLLSVVETSQETGFISN